MCVSGRVAVAENPSRVKVVHTRAAGVRAPAREQGMNTEESGHGVSELEQVKGESTKRASPVGDICTLAG